MNHTQLLSRVVGTGFLGSIASYSVLYLVRDKLVYKVTSFRDIIRRDTEKRYRQGFR